MATSKIRRYIGDIAGGQKLIARDIGANITVQTIWDNYRWIPGFKEMLKLKVKAIWSNGLTTEEIEADRYIELKDGHEWCFRDGWSAFVIDATKEPPTVEAWHVAIDGIGYVVTKTSPRGYPMEIEIKVKTNENDPDKGTYNIPAYPCEIDENGEYIRERPIPGEFGFFLIRTRGGIKGLQGLPEYMSLIDPFRSQYEILKFYIPFAKKQGMAFPHVRLKHNNATNRALVNSQWSAKPTSNKLLITSIEDEVDWKSPQHQTYDPTYILEWINKMIARETQMNKLMLEGDPSGNLSASETAINNWDSNVKEDQVFWRSQFKPIWIALGAEDDTAYKDPTKPTFISLMTGLKAAREAMQGIVDNESIINVFNEFLMERGKSWELKAAPPEQQFNQFGGMGNNEPGSNSKGSQTNQEQT